MPPPVIIMQKVYILEDEVLLRDLMCDLVAGHISLEVCGVSGNGTDGLKEVLRLKPSIFIVDIQLPGLNGLEVIERLKVDLPSLKILVMSGNLTTSRLKRIFMLKVDGIIEKAAGLKEMERALNAMEGGQSYFSPTIVQRMPELMFATEKDGTLESLTSREREVLQLIGEGHTTKEIAAKLFISARTADVHRTHIMQKLNTHNVAGLTRMAVSFGLVDIDSPQN